MEAKWRGAKTLASPLSPASRTAPPHRLTTTIIAIVLATIWAIDPNSAT